jgi:hypothetical protein
MKMVQQDQRNSERLFPLPVVSLSPRALPRSHPHQSLLIARAREFPLSGTTRAPCPHCVALSELPALHRPCRNPTHHGPTRTHRRHGEPAPRHLRPRPGGSAHPVRRLELPTCSQPPLIASSLALTNTLLTINDPHHHESAQPFSPPNLSSSSSSSSSLSPSPSSSSSSSHHRARGRVLADTDSSRTTPSSLKIAICPCARCGCWRAARSPASDLVLVGVQLPGAC